MISKDHFLCYRWVLFLIGAISRKGREGKGREREGREEKEGKGRKGMVRI